MPNIVELLIELTILTDSCYIPFNMAEKNTVSSEALKKLEEQLTCPICLEQITNPKILPCYHSFCLHCLEGMAPELIEGKLCLPCPTCRSPCPEPDKGLASLPTSFVINNLSEVYGLMKKVLANQQASCDNCDKTNAISYCKQCSKFLCPECHHHHKNWRKFSNHQTLSLEKVASTAYQLPQAKPEATDNCTDHNKPLVIFCETCEELICQLCTVRKHSGHNYDVVIDTYRKQYDTIVKSSLQPLNQQVDRLSQCMTSLTDRRKAINEQSQKTKEGVHLMITELKQVLDETERKLIRDVNVALLHKINVLDHQIKEVETALGQVRECRDHVEQSVRIGTPQQVLSTKSQMMSRTESVISNVKDKTFQPLEQANIELVKSDNINEILKNIGTIKCTVLPPSKVNVSCHPIPLTNQESTITVSFDGSPVPLSLISFYMTFPVNSRPKQFLMKESRQSGQYNIVFTPATRGLHQLHVRVRDSKIPGSPVNIPVSVPPEKMGTPVKAISGLRGPSGVAVTDYGLMIVSERDGNCINLLDKEGKKIGSFGFWGSKKAQLCYPYGLALTSNRTILVADQGNNRIQKFTMEGECLSCVGTYGNGPLQFDAPCGIAVNSSTQQVYVTDRDNHRVQVLNSDLTFSRKFGSYGFLQGQFYEPVDVDVDNEGFVYVTDSGNDRVQKFTPDGLFVCSFGEEQSEPGHLQCPVGITVNEDLIYVNDARDYVTVYNKNSGMYRCRIGLNLFRKGHGDWGPTVVGVTVDQYGYLIVCCHCDGQIKIF